MDFSTALCDPKGEIIAQGVTLPNQLGALASSARSGCSASDRASLFGCLPTVKDACARTSCRGSSARSRLTIVCAEGGEREYRRLRPRWTAIARDVHARHGGWLHVDGAFGLWATATASLAHHVKGADGRTPGRPTRTNGSTSRTIRDRDRGASGHRAAMTDAPYLVAGRPKGDPCDSSPEISRRARSLAVRPPSSPWTPRSRRPRGPLLCPGAAFRRPLATETVVRSSTRWCSIRCSSDSAVRRPAIPTFGTSGRPRVQQDGTCWLGGTTGTAVRDAGLGLQLVDDEDDVDLSAEAILRALADASVSS